MYSYTQVLYEHSHRTMSFKYYYIKFCDFLYFSVMLLVLWECQYQTQPPSLPRWAWPHVITYWRKYAETTNSCELSVVFYQNRFQLLNIHSSFNY